MRISQNKYLIVAIFLSFLALNANLHAEQNDHYTVKLEDSSYSEFIDFLYEYSRLTRLNIEWFGWYAVDNPKAWYENTNNNFKMTLSLLSINNGYMLFTNDFDGKTMRVLVDKGDEKQQWIEALDKFQKAVSERGWVIITGW